MTGRRPAGALMTARGNGPSKNPEVGPYFIVPKGLFQNGIAARIGPFAVTIYAALCEQANRKNGNTLSVSDRTLAADTGVAERTIRDIRSKLFEAGLVTFVREPGSSYTYTLILVQPARIPVKERLRQPKRRRANYAPQLAAADTWKLSEAPQHSP